MVRHPPGLTKRPIVRRTSEGSKFLWNLREDETHNVAFAKTKHHGTVFNWGSCGDQDMTIEERLDRLKKQSARWRAAAICLGVCLLLVTGLGAAAFQDRSRMTLEDNAGRMRISLQIHPDFGPMISLFDNEDKERLRIGSDQNANGKPFVWMFDKQFNRVKTIEP